MTTPAEHDIAATAIEHPAAAGAGTNAFEDAPQREIALPQGTIRYRELGTGAPIVFVHGLLVNGLLWRKVVPPLAQSFRCIVPDLPLGGHRLPMSADADLTPPGLARLIAAFIAELGLEDVTLVGNDTGGALCQLVITDHPERIGRLVLTNCDAYENFLPPLFRPFQWIAHVPGALFAATQPMRIGALHRLPIAFGWVAKHEIDRRVRDDYLHGVLHDRAIRRDTGKFLRGISSRYTLDAAQRFGEFRRPVLLPWAVEDRAFTWAYAERIAAAFPDVRLERIEDSLTFVSEDQPERLVELIAEFAIVPSRAVA